MHTFIADLFAQVGMSPKRSVELADYLVCIDLRCVFSHGISIRDEHREALDAAAAKFGIETPFDRYESSRFDSSTTGH